MRLIMMKSLHKGPKRHHSVAEMLQKRFTDDEGGLFFFDNQRPDLGVRWTRPHNLFCRHDLYSEIGKDGSKDPALEHKISILEGQIDLLIEKTVSATRNNRPPCFTPAEKAAWDRFLILQWKRVPDLHACISSLRDFETEYDQLLDQLRDRIPNLQQEIEKLREPTAKKRMIHNIKVDALARPSTVVETMIARRGLAVLGITRPGKSFVIGSHPVIKLTRPGKTHILDSEVEVWLPVASDVAIGLGRAAGTEIVVPVSDTAQVRHLNEAIVRQSTMFAARSEALVRSLGRPGWTAPMMA